MKSCVVFGAPRAGNHLVLRLLNLLGLKDYHGNLVTPYRQEDLFNIPQTDHCGFAAHMQATPANISLYKETIVAGIYISRDINDVAFSRACLTANTKETPPADVLAEVAEYAKRKMAEVEGWATCPDVYSTTYEKLVGSHGGGDDGSQMEEIENIGALIGCETSEEESISIQRQLWTDRGSSIHEPRMMARIGNGEAVKAP